MIDCGGTWCFDINCVSCCPHHHYTERELSLSTQSLKEAVIDELNAEIELAKNTPVPEELWGNKFFWDTKYHCWSLLSYPNHHFTKKEHMENPKWDKYIEKYEKHMASPEMAKYKRWAQIDMKERDDDEMERFVKRMNDDIRRCGCGITDQKETDPINHPSHYCNRSMEAIDIIEMCISIEKNPMVAYNMSNVLKYLLRFRDKGKDLEDLQKARWYLNRMIDKVGEEVSPD